MIIDNLEKMKMTENEELESIYRKYGTDNLEICFECNQYTMEVTPSFEGYGYRCHFCGYIHKSSWEGPIHGKFYKNKKV